jgi:methyl-accepting chemotaxis protein
MSLKKPLIPIIVRTTGTSMQTAAAIIFALVVWSATAALSPAEGRDSGLSVLRMLTAGFAFCAFASFWKLLATRRGTRALLQNIRAIADGQLGALTVQPAVGDSDEVVFDLKARVQDVVIKVRNQTSGFAQTSGLLSTDNKALFARSDRQRELLEQTASSTEQITVAVRETAENAKRANQMIAIASVSAARASNVVTNVEVAMGAIRESSAKISAITGVVSGIAFQTNILALNAAVEAARAGDSGRGFAVVASEVRVLAQRVAAASGEIQALIKDAEAKVRTGHEEALLAGTSMRDIEASVTKIAAVMTEICTASHEQSIGIESINDTLLQLDRMTHDDLRLAEEISSAAKSLHDQAISLTNVVSGFYVGTDEFGNKDDAVALVEAAIAYAEEARMRDLIEAINDLCARTFADRDLYLVVARLDGEIVAHGGNPRLVGLDTRKLLDADSTPFGAQLLAVSRSQGTGWVDFRFAHPVTQKISSKSAYVKRHGDFFIACGFYTADSQRHVAQP